MLIACATFRAEISVARAHALKTIVGRFTAPKISLVLRPGTVMATWFVGWVNANKIIAAISTAQRNQAVMSYEMIEGELIVLARVSQPVRNFVNEASWDNNDVERGQDS